MIPGKKRYIASPYPGSEPFERLVSARYSLATMCGMGPIEFLAAVEKWGSRAAYDQWLGAYRVNSGSALDHIAWGADRDLGDGHYLHGAMDDRAYSNALRLWGSVEAARAAVEGRRCCLVGAWDGTEALLLHALGATSVDCIEEVPAFAEMATLQLRAWQVPGNVAPLSIYELDVRETWQQYDLLYVPGVLYHLTDLPAALVILWSMLAPGGVLAFESIVASAPAQPTAHYLGASVPGWNWWRPNAACYEALLRDCGFPDGRTVETSLGRGWWDGTKARAIPALACGAAGFSKPNLLRTIAALQKDQK